MDRQFVVVIDPGMGNISSVRRAVQYCAVDSVICIVSDEQKHIEEADKVIFPGQGAAMHCMDGLKVKNLIGTVVVAYSSKPFLGICLGMQILMDISSENKGTKCLGMFRGGNAVLPRWPECRVPHIGWNSVRQVRRHRLWYGIDDEECFYFDHSYAVIPSDDSVISGVSNHGCDFVSVIAEDFVYAVQFHPEKSSVQGLQLLRNFLSWR